MNHKLCFILWYILHVLAFKYRTSHPYFFVLSWEQGLDKSCEKRKEHCHREILSIKRRRDRSGWMCGGCAWFSCEADTFILKCKRKKVQNITPWCLHRFYKAYVCMTSTYIWSWPNYYYHPLLKNATRSTAELVLSKIITDLRWIMRVIFLKTKARGMCC